MKMRQTLNDYVYMYSAINNSDDTFLMLKDYVLDSRLDRDILNAKILLDLGERTPYFNNTTLLKKSIENWFSTHEWNITKLVDTLYLEYNPLYTKDWYEDHEGTDVHSKEGTETNVLDSDKEVQDSGQDITKVSEETEEVSNPSNPRTTTTTNEVSAYNSSSYQPQDRSTEVLTGAMDTEVSSEQTFTHGKNTDTQLDETNTMTYDVDETDNYDSTRHYYGKDGTMTYAELIEKERKNAMFNIYEWIVENLGSDILLGVF